MVEPTRIYLAGPFFNAAQVELIKTIEDTLESYNIPHFSPRKLGLNSNPSTTKPTPEQAANIFKADYQEICRSTHVLAVVDWALPPGQSVHLIREGTTTSMDHVSPALNIPDSGTVWEMGCAYALRVPVILFTANPSKQMNLMLTQSAKGCLYGIDHLQSYLGNGLDQAWLEGWKGDHR
jgi:nucleoside deoxyribosyltransferase